MLKTSYGLPADESFQLSTPTLAQMRFTIRQITYIHYHGAVHLSIDIQSCPYRAIIVALKYPMRRPTFEIKIVTEPSMHYSLTIEYVILASKFPEFREIDCRWCNRVETISYSNLIISHVFYRISTSTFASTVLKLQLLNEFIIVINWQSGLAPQIFLLQ